MAKSFRHKSLLMCPPTYFTVEYSINPWMKTSVPVDVDRAIQQWNGLKEKFEAYGHTVHLLDPQPGWPDMVYAANGAVSVDGAVYGARFAYTEREGESAFHRQWYQANAWSDFIEPIHTNEGEGDFVYVAERGLILAGYGFRTDPAAHAEAAEALRRPVIGLRLIDPRIYHLDVGLFALNDHNICYYPGSFSPSSQEILRRLFPEAILATEEDALAFGLNAFSDGTNVFLAAEAQRLADNLASAGFTPVPIELSELRKGGGSVKCCTAELRKAGDA